MARSLISSRATAIDNRSPLPPLIVVGSSFGLLERFARLITDGIVVVLEGIYASFGGALDVVSKEWYHDPPEHDHPDPASFGFALRQLEQLLCDVHDQLPLGSVPPVLLGAERAPDIVLALARIVPDLLAGVIAFDGKLLDVPGSPPLDNDLDGLPFLLLTSGGTERDADSVVRTLESQGACVTVSGSAGLESHSTQSTDEIRHWLANLETTSSTVTTRRLPDV